jgi:hypothetical protein
MRETCDDLVDTRMKNRSICNAAFIHSHNKLIDVACAADIAGAASSCSSRSSCSGCGRGTAVAAYVRGGTALDVSTLLCRCSQTSGSCGLETAAVIPVKA